MLTKLIAAIIILTLVNSSEDLIDGTKIANCSIGNKDEDKLDFDFEGYKSHDKIYEKVWVWDDDF